MLEHDLLVDRLAHEGGELLPPPGSAEARQPTIRKVAQTRSKRKAEQVEQGEDLVGDAAGIDMVHEGVELGGVSNRARFQASAISHFETGTRKPSFDNLRWLADALEVTTDYLLGRVTDAQALAGADRLHRHLDRLTSDDREMAEDFLKLLADKAKSRAYWAASLAAEKVVREHDIATLPVDPIALARSLGIEVRAKPTHTQGVSGMLLRSGNRFGIAYATHIDNIGFQNFSVAHELGHYFLSGHIDAVLADGDVHESRAGFASGNRYEMEADHFAAGLLMPRLLFMEAMRTSGEGLTAIGKLASLCRTSLTATGIRYVQCSRDPLAIVLSTGSQINYCFMSDALKEVKGLNWIRKGEGLSRNTTTFAFNQDVDRVGGVDLTGGTSDLQDWFGGDRSIPITEEVAGLGSYGKTLTVLTALDLEERLKEIEEEENLIESWTPKFRL